jgi:hypothetical protein
VQGTNIVRKEHGIKEAECIAADTNLTLLDVKRTPDAGATAKKSGKTAKPAKPAAKKKSKK